MKAAAGTTPAPPDRPALDDRVPEPSGDADRGATDGGGRPGRDPVTVAAWALLVVLTAITCWGTLRADYRTQPLVGDQAEQLLQAESIAYDGHNLSFDQQDVDRIAQHDLGWRNTPYLDGVIFQRNDHGWAFAKPYGYSLVLAGPLRLLGPAVGVAVANTVLLLALEGLIAALLLLYHRGPAVPLVTTGIVLVANTVTYAYPLVVELFTAVLVAVFLYGTLRGLRDGRAWWTALGFAAAGVMVAEKAPLVAVIGPVALVALVRIRAWPRRAALVATAAVAFAVAVVPYLFYSDGQSFNAYAGERYYGHGPVPFGDEPSQLVPAGTEGIFTAAYVGNALTSGWGDKVEAMATYFVGRPTGLAVFMPVAVVVLGLTVAGLRRVDGVGLAVLASMLGYIALYTILLPHNYYGGQSYGSRYFVQVCPLVAALASAARLPSRRLALGALAALAFGAATMWPHLTNPADALVDLDETTAVQRQFPFEHDQPGRFYFQCGRRICREGGGPRVGDVGLAGGALGRHIRAVTKAARDVAANPPPGRSGGG